MTKESFSHARAAFALRERNQKIEVYNLIADLAPASVTGAALKVTLQRIDNAFAAGAAAVNRDIRQIFEDSAEAEKLIRQVGRLYPRRRVTTPEH